MANGNGPPQPDFTKPRTVAGLLLCGVAGVVALIDAVRVDVTIDPVQFFGLVGFGAALLGVRGLDRFFKP